MTKQEIRTELHKLVDTIENESLLRTYFLLIQYGYKEEVKEKLCEDKNTLSDHVTA